MLQNNPTPAFPPPQSGAGIRKGAVFTAMALAFLGVLTVPVHTDVPEFPAVSKPARRLFPGEKLVYKISYLGITVGQAEAEIGTLEDYAGRKAYPVTVRVRSHPVIDLIYKIRDEHRTWMDAGHLYSLRYEKKLKEGRYHVHEAMTYDQEKHTAHYLSYTNHSEKEMLIPKNVQDQLSCGYWFRTLEISPRTRVTIPVNADEKNWELQVHLFDAKPMLIPGVGRFQALEAEPVIKFQGIFVKKGKIRGWISLDERRIPLKMKVRVPILGTVTALLTSYVAGKA